VSGRRGRRNGSSIRTSRRIVGERASARMATRLLHPTRELEPGVLVGVGYVEAEQREVVHLTMRIRSSEGTAFSSRPERHVAGATVSHGKRHVFLEGPRHGFRPAGAADGPAVDEQRGPTSAGGKPATMLREERGTCRSPKGRGYRSARRSATSDGRRPSTRRVRRAAGG